MKSLIHYCMGMLVFGLSAQDISLEKGLIPIPVSLEKKKGEFKVTPASIIYFEEASLKKNAEYLAEYLQELTGIKLSIQNNSEQINQGIVLKLSEEIKEEEGYVLDVTSKRLILKAKTQEGIFRGLQTVFQLLPEKLETAKSKAIWAIPAVHIQDYPAYVYRGSMLDVSRHFFDVETVKRYIDHLAFYKLNTLHLHLSDDQGWRIEIKSWPKLTEIGAASQVGEGDGGFYTQEDYKEIVRYAQERFITVVPEIDMPGHTNAALTSYPELNCDGKATEAYRGTKVGFSSLCIDKEITYTFVEDVIREITAITTGPYFHIGGDESLSTEEEDYITFVNRVQKLVYQYGKTPIGWDEIQHAEIKPTTIVQFWGKKENAIEAAKKEAKLIMSPSTRAYMDMKYDSLTKLGLNWAGYINLEKAYHWDPNSFLDGVREKDILGVEAPLWTETIETFKDIQYMVFPRLLGYAEISWSPSARRDWKNYQKRLAQHYRFLTAQQINFYESDEVPFPRK
ncbi:beta-N-acetylhexosaminidase [Galbibacter sp. BG1]|uniref:beta-N-acetylhexosaminidase n=1 Tax=Galbibacter sp. BG1 TaxID=1170699 RepID=UPI0015BF93E8|nr:beta-N-acetylhexosaminidase [Galbibacter sp. BG1]QLE00416.1 beta-N-acetylhexosaminidase [Galbibacter sp. BG1]